MTKAISIFDRLERIFFPIILAGAVVTILVAPFPLENLRWYAAGMLTVFVPAGVYVVLRLRSKKKKKTKVHGVIVFW